MIDKSLIIPRNVAKARYDTYLKQRKPYESYRLWYYEISKQTKLCSEALATISGIKTDIRL